MVIGDCEPGFSQLWLLSETVVSKYANSLWNLYRKQDIKALEKVQMRATRLVTPLRNKPYQERLKALDLLTLKFRRLRGDMIETYKVLSGIYDTSVAPVIPIISEHATRGKPTILLPFMFNLFSTVALSPNLLIP